MRSAANEGPEETNHGNNHTKSPRSGLGKTTSEVIVTCKNLNKTADSQFQAFSAAKTSLKALENEAE